MGSDNSTGNFIVHLSTHRMTEESYRRRTNNRPISICNDDEGFVEFIHELDPNYQIPSDKTIQQLMAESYNQIKVVLTKKFSKNIISYSITTDLWTVRSRNGYIGITYSFIDNNFNICEAILAVQYVLYSHTSDNICKVLRDMGSLQ
ncbi:unnamed protein product [Rhizophagus irregularis]|uniref:Uncharacterized protein n=1 Tax=Rhizophagus irregularis TaxID=588596 RepID=A0A915ZEU1_9GLOM|nr:unnamed protein product [Rhizophagus irregularis]